MIHKKRKENNKFYDFRHIRILDNLAVCTGMFHFELENNWDSRMIWDFKYKFFLSFYFFSLSQQASIGFDFIEQI